MPDVSGLEIEIAQPAEDQARLVMQWRNDPVTLAGFYHREPKVWASFWPEFRTTYFAHADLPPIFVRENGDRVSFLRFQSIAAPKPGHNRCCDVSINVAPSARGRGIGAKALNAASRFLAARGVDGVLAEIRVENEASVRAFEKAGFTRLDRTIKHIDDTGEDCPIFRYFLDLRASRS